LAKVTKHLTASFERISHCNEMYPGNKDSIWLRLGREALVTTWRM
jgi:hypothetical protein